MQGHGHCRGTFNVNAGKTGPAATLEDARLVRSVQKLRMQTRSHKVGRSTRKKQIISEANSSSIEIE